MSRAQRDQSGRTFTLALIPVAIVLNIVVGQLASGSPVYLDSIGTVLVGALLGPWWAALTGILANVIWALLGNTVAVYFAYVGAVIGLLSGFSGRLGVFQRPAPLWLSVMVGGVFTFALTMFVMQFITATRDDSGNTVLRHAGDLIVLQPLVFALAIVAGMAAGYFVIRSAGYAGIAGLITGLVAAVISAPMAAVQFGGVTGGGTDLLVAAFRASGEGILQSTLAQGTVSDPFDKMTSFMLVWLIIQVLPRRLLLRFPTARRAAQLADSSDGPIGETAA